MSISNKVRIAAAACLVIAVGIGLGLVFRSGTTKSEKRQQRNTARAAALVNYRNSLIGCQTRGNEQREYTFSLASALSKVDRPEVAAPAREIVRSMKEAEFARPDGTIICKEAITKP